MGAGVLTKWGMEISDVVVIIGITQIILLIITISITIKYNKLRQSYRAFMRGRDGRNLEQILSIKFAEMEDISRLTKKNHLDIKDVYRRMSTHYQKIGIVKYDAFLEMGGKLSFALTMLDEKNSGWIMNVMHSRDGCYTYLKEIVKGESFIALAEEETESLERAIYQEAYDVRMVLQEKR